MNKIEQQILQEVGYTNENIGSITLGELQIARVAVKISLELAEKAFKAGGDGKYYDEGLGGMNDEFSREYWEDFKKDIL